MSEDIGIEGILERPTIADQAKALIDAQNEKGVRKYGGTLDETKPARPALLQHLAEELADALQYVLAVKTEEADLLAALEAEENCQRILHRRPAATDEVELAGWLDERDAARSKADTLRAATLGRAGRKP